MGRRQPLYTKTRNDALTHERTEWFSVLEHGIRLQCQVANQLGVLERSVASIARIASGRTMTVSPEEVRESISMLSNTSHVVWFREFDILWWVEMADEQQPTDTPKNTQYWTQLRTQLLPKLVNQVRVAICARYPKLGSPNPPESLGCDPSKPKLVNQVGLFGSHNRDLDRDSDRDRDRESPTRAGASSGRSKPGLKGHAAQTAQAGDSLVDRVIEHFNLRRSEVKRNAKGFRADSDCHRKPIERATRREQATFEDWRERIDRLAAAASRDPFWIPHMTPEHLHWAKNWEKWSHDTAVPESKSAGASTPDFAPSDFSRPENCTSRGVQFADLIDPNDESTL